MLEDYGHFSFWLVFAAQTPAYYFTLESSSANRIIWYNSGE